MPANPSTLMRQALIMQTVDTPFGSLIGAYELRGYWVAHARVHDFLMQMRHGRLQAEARPAQYYY